MSGTNLRAANARTARLVTILVFHVLEQFVVVIVRIAFVAIETIVWYAYL